MRFADGYVAGADCDAQRTDPADFVSGEVSGFID